MKTQLAQGLTELCICLCYVCVCVSVCVHDGMRVLISFNSKDAVELIMKNVFII